MKLYQHKISRVKVAIKVMKKESIDFDAREIVMKELAVLKKLDHPNVLKLHEIIDETDGEIFLVTEYYGRGSLRQLIDA